MESDEEIEIIYSKTSDPSADSRITKAENVETDCSNEKENEKIHEEVNEEVGEEENCAESTKSDDTQPFVGRKDTPEPSDLDSTGDSPSEIEDQSPIQSPVALPSDNEEDQSRMQSPVAVQSNSEEEEELSNASVESNNSLDGEIVAIEHLNEKSDLPDYFSKCVFCDCDMTQSEKMPMILRCLHSICCACFENQSENMNRILCKECNVSSSRSNLIENRILAERARRTNGKDKICMSCTEKKVVAAFHCSNCDHWLCHSCLPAHLSEGLHTLMNAEIAPPSFQTVCSKHNNQGLDIFCEVCKDVFCASCMFAEHKDHCHKSAETVHSAGKEQLKLDLQSMAEKETFIKNCIQKLESHVKALGESVIAAEKDCKAFEEKLIEASKSRCRDILDNLNSWREENIKLYEEKRETLLAVNKSVKNGVTFGELVLDASYRTALYSKQFLENQFSELKVMRVEEPSDSVPEVKVVPKNLEQFLEDINAVGKIESSSCNSSTAEDLFEGEPVSEISASSTPVRGHGVLNFRTSLNPSSRPLFPDHLLSSLVEKLKTFSSIMGNPKTLPDLSDKQKTILQLFPFFAKKMLFEIASVLESLCDYPASNDRSQMSRMAKCVNVMSGYGNRNHLEEEMKSLAEDLRKIGLWDKLGFLVAIPSTVSEPITDQTSNSVNPESTSNRTTGHVPSMTKSSGTQLDSIGNGFVLPPRPELQAFSRDANGNPRIQVVYAPTIRPTMQRSFSQPPVISPNSNPQVQLHLEALTGYRNTQHLDNRLIVSPVRGIPVSHSTGVKQGSLINTEHSRPVLINHCGGRQMSHGAYGMEQRKEPTRSSAGVQLSSSYSVSSNRSALQHTDSPLSSQRHNNSVDHCYTASNTNYQIPMTAIPSEVLSDLSAIPGDPVESSTSQRKSWFKVPDDPPTPAPANANLELEKCFRIYVPPKVHPSANQTVKETVLQTAKKDEIATSNKVSSPVTNDRIEGGIGVAPPSEGLPTSTSEQATGSSTSEIPGTEEYCKICHDGGELIFCDFCPSMYHLTCHIPEIKHITESEKWQCNKCIDLDVLERRLKRSRRGRGMIPRLRAVAIKLLFHLHYDWELSRHFRMYFEGLCKFPLFTEETDDEFRNLDSIKHQFLSKNIKSFKKFVRLVRKMFNNARILNEAGSEIYNAACRLEQEYFENYLLELAPNYVNDDSRNGSRISSVSSEAFEEEEEDEDDPTSSGDEYPGPSSAKKRRRIQILPED
ncbi:E3 ubiquitin-protein ligase TRIM33-like isoform X2 [Artemia franciscana]|uniref:E3 ubiquitin-protein ligase TRIM33-like isoform X2 n=1 Tax=Artemia franciscana TaxID=6661 RepID=UPI0032D9FB9A